jgi:potassium-dependent mechanosensitive channel
MRKDSISAAMNVWSALRLSALFSLLAQSVMAAPLYQAPGAPAAPSFSQSMNEPRAPIQASKLAPEAEWANARVHQIENEIDKMVRISNVQAQLAAYADSLQRFRLLLESGGLGHLDEMLNLRQEMKRLSLRLTRMQGELTPRLQIIEARREELIKLQTLWSMTIAKLDLQGIPPFTRELAAQVQRQVQKAQNRIEAARTALLTLQGQISAQNVAANNLRAQTDIAIDEAKGRLFTLDQEPLWKALASATFSASMTESAQGFYYRRALPLVDYLRSNTERLGVHLMLSALLIFLLMAVSRKSRTWAGSQAGDTDGEQALSHPVASAIVLSLLLSFQLYPNAPTTLYRLPLLLIVLPMLRLASAAPERDQRRMFCYLTGIYVLRRLDELVATDDSLHRIVLLVLTILAILGVLWAAKIDSRASATRKGSWRRARIFLLYLAGLILTGSVIGNIVGSVNLATLLADACISSAFAGTALFAGVLTLENYLIPLLRSPLSRISPAIRNHRQLFRRRTSFLIRFAACVSWVWLSLGLFGLTETIGAGINPVLAAQWSFGQLTFSIEGILLFAATIWLAALAARFLSFMLEEDILTRVTLPQGIPASVSLLVRNSIIGLGLILALAGAGVQWSQIALVAGAIGVGIGLGLQNLVASFIAGLILIFERPIRVGDAVEIGTVIGIVTRIGLRSSSVHTYDGSEVICPNSSLISQALVNWTLSSQVRRVELPVGAAYHSNPETVLEILKNVAQGTPGVLKDPEPVVLFRGFGESSLNFVLRFFCSFNDSPAVASKVGIRVNKALHEAGIEIPFPQRSIRISRQPASGSQQSQKGSTPDENGRPCKE